MNDLDLSICIVNWNSCDLLRGLLESLRVAGAELAVEVIVVDNASTDGSAEIVATEFPDAKLNRNGQNLGFSKANTQAVTNARGRFVLFLNNDTIVRSGALERMTKLLHKRPDVVGGRTVPDR